MANAALNQVEHILLLLIVDLWEQWPFFSVWILDLAYFKNSNRILPQKYFPIRWSVHISSSLFAMTLHTQRASGPKPLPADFCDLFGCFDIKRIVRHTKSKDKIYVCSDGVVAPFYDCLFSILFPMCASSGALKVGDSLSDSWIKHWMCIFFCWWKGKVWCFHWASGPNQCLSVLLETFLEEIDVKAATMQNIKTEFCVHSPRIEKYSSWCICQHSHCNWSWIWGWNLRAVMKKMMWDDSTVGMKKEFLISTEASVVFAFKRTA